MHEVAANVTAAAGSQRAEDVEVAGWTEAMRRHVEGAPEIYRPGAFWSELLAQNLEMLRGEGIRNFKRTVSNNYYNWLVVSLPDPQMRNALRRWLERPALSVLRARMESPDGLRTTEGSFELTPKAARRYRFFVAATWEHARRLDELGLAGRLSEPETGNPVRLHVGGRLVSQDLANSIVECSYAARSGHIRDGARIAELGAGYGRLAHVVASARRLTYCIFDIPPALALSQWYLGELLGRDRIVPFTGEVDLAALEPGKVAFFTPDQLEAFPDGWFDLTQTISTLPEMPERQAEHYLGMLTAKSSGEVFLKQWRDWRNEADDARFSEDRYVPPAGWERVARRVDPIQPMFFNQRWRRAA